MATTVYWNPSGDANIDHYLVEYASAEAGPFSSLATVNHDTGDSALYDAERGQFYYTHAGGTSSTWYRLAAVDDSAQQSAYSTPFQAGTPLSAAPEAYTSDALIAQAKRLALLPVSQATFTEDDILRMADDIILGDLLPAILSVREDFYTGYADFPVESATANATKYVTLPYRAIGNKVRLVQLVDASGYPVDVPRLDPEDLPDLQTLGFWVQGNRLYYVNQARGDCPTLRVRYFVRPGRLVPVSECAVIQTLDATNKLVTPYEVPSNFSSVGLFDFIRVNPGFDTLAIDQSGALSGATYSMTEDLPVDLDAGDIMARRNETCMVQLPVEFHPVLAQLVAAKALEALGDFEGAKLSLARAQSQRAAALNLIGHRVEGNTKTVVPTHSPWRRSESYRRWY